MDRQILVPSYYDKFSCLGGECGYTCCQEWPIHITKRDYKDLMKQRVSPELKEKMQGFAMKQRGETFDEKQTYAKLRMRENGICPFLSDQGLCSLQIECGANMLPSICRIFPRIVNLVSDSAYELSVRLACQETVRLLIETTEPIQFDVVQNHAYDRQASYVFPNNMPDENPLLLHYWSIKALGVGVLQNRFYTLPQRILYLGIIFGRLMEYEATGRLAEAEPLLQALMQQEDSAALRQSLEKLPDNSPVSAPLQLTLANMQGIKGYEELFDRVMNAIGSYDEQTDTATIEASKYQAARTRFDAFCEQHPQVMENIAVHLFHELAMPFGGVYFGMTELQKLDIWQNYLLYCRLFVQIRFILGALVTPDTPLNEVAVMVSIIGRQFPSHMGNAQVLVKKMEEMQLSTIDRLSVVLKG